MNIRHLGTTYGGWTIDLDSVNNGDTIIDGGLGEDLSFDIELCKLKDIRIIGVDPTLKSHQYVEKMNLENFFLIKKAIWSENNEVVKIHKNTNSDWVSESIHSEHINVSEQDFYEVETISLEYLIKTYNPCLIKLDIEGSEYDVIKQALGIKQICVEFHHNHLENKSLEDTLEYISFFEKNGYKILHSTHNYQEVTFLKL
jgi:FkbM family methyltransferase